MRLQAALLILSQGHIVAVWNKGHATLADVEEGRSTALDRRMNAIADAQCGLAASSSLAGPPTELEHRHRHDFEVTLKVQRCLVEMVQHRKLLDVGYDWGGEMAEDAEQRLPSWGPMLAR